MKWKILFFLLLFVTSVTAVPQIPAMYTGTITLEGTPFAGVQVEVKDVNGNTLVLSDATGEDGRYIAQVKWDDPSVVGKDGVTKGDLVLFYVNNENLKNDTISEQGVNELNFEFGVAPELSPDYVPENSGSNSDSTTSVNDSLNNETVNITTVSNNTDQNSDVVNDNTLTTDSGDVQDTTPSVVPTTTSTVNEPVSEPIVVEENKPMPGWVIGIIIIVSIVILGLIIFMVIK